MIEIKIYIVNLAAYNAGYLKGEWTTLPIDEDDLNEVINKVLDTSNMSDKARWEIGLCEEVAIHDYEGFIKVSECTHIQTLNEQLEELNAYNIDEDELECLLGFIIDLDEAIALIKKGDIWFIDNIDSYTTLAETLANEHDYFGWFNSTMNIPESYINWEAVGRDLDCEGEWFIGSNNIAMFIPNC